MGKVRRRQAAIEIRESVIVDTALGLKATIHGDMFWGGPGPLAREVDVYQNTDYVTYYYGRHDL